jgi:hypothetical protein
MPPSPQAGGGSPGMTPGLAQMLGAQAPPQTPMSANTPDIRRNPTHEWYEAMQKVQAVARQAMTKSDEQDPIVKDFLSAVQQTAIKLITVGTQAKPVVAAGLARAFDNFAPQIAGQLDMLSMTLMQMGQQPPSMPPAGPGGMAMPGAIPGEPPGPPPGGSPMGGSPAPMPGPGMAALR